MQQPDPNYQNKYENSIRRNETKQKICTNYEFWLHVTIYSQIFDLRGPRVCDRVWKRVISLRLFFYFYMIGRGTSTNSNKNVRLSLAVCACVSHALVRQNTWHVISLFCGGAVGGGVGGNTPSELHWDGSVLFLVFVWKKEKRLFGEFILVFLSFQTSLHKFCRGPRLSCWWWPRFMCWPPSEPAVGCWISSCGNATGPDGC